LALEGLAAEEAQVQQWAAGFQAAVGPGSPALERAWRQEWAVGFEAAVRLVAAGSGPGRAQQEVGWGVAESAAPLGAPQAWGRLEEPVGRQVAHLAQGLGRLRALGSLAEELAVLFREIRLEEGLNQGHQECQVELHQVCQVQLEDPGHRARQSERTIFPVRHS
jgi:hypothetical protein